MNFPKLFSSLGLLSTLAIASLVELPKPKAASAQPISDSSLVLVDDWETEAPTIPTEKKWVASSLPNRPLSIPVKHSVLPAGVPLYIQYGSSVTPDSFKPQTYREFPHKSQELDESDAGEFNVLGVTPDKRPSIHQESREFAHKSQQLDSSDAGEFKVLDVPPENRQFTREESRVATESLKVQRNREFPNNPQQVEKSDSDLFKVIDLTPEKYPEIFKWFWAVVIGGILLVFLALYLLFVVIKFIIWIVLLPLQIVFSLLHF